MLLGEWRALAAASVARRVEAMRRMHDGVHKTRPLKHAFSAWRRATPRKADVSAAVARLSRRVRLRHSMRVWCAATLAQRAATHPPPRFVS